MTKPEAARYRTTNWKSYNSALRRRGSLLIWLDKDMVWLAPKTGRNGLPPVFSGEADQETVRGTVCPTNAVQFCLMVNVLFGLPLRQTTGMVGSIVQLAGLDWPVPDFSTLSRRQIGAGPWPQWGRVSLRRHHGPDPEPPRAWPAEPAGRH